VNTLALLSLATHSQSSVSRIFTAFSTNVDVSNMSASGTAGSCPFVFLNHRRKHNNSPSMTNQQRYRSNTQELSFIDSGDPFLHLSLRITANTTDQNLVCSLQRPLIQPTLSWLPGNNNSSYLKEAAKVTCFFFEASSRLCDLLTSPPCYHQPHPKP